MLKTIRSLSSTLSTDFNHSRKLSLLSMNPQSKNPFEYTIDKYKGVTISEFKNSETWSTPERCVNLQTALNLWKSEGVTGVWFVLPTKQADWVPILAKEGFEFHHAKNGILSMLKWIDDSSCAVPPYSHHMVGVGGMVINDKDEILVVQEKIRERDHWKLPGGYVEPEEDLGAAAIREVFEETGIKTVFKSMVAFRHSHKFLYGNSDLYFIAELSPESSEIKMCDRELSKSKWMKISDYLDSPIVHSTNKFLASRYLKNREKGAFIKLNELISNNRQNMVYFIDMDMN